MASSCFLTPIRPGGSCKILLNQTGDSRRHGPVPRVGDLHLRTTKTSSFAMITSQLAVWRTSPRDPVAYAAIITDVGSGMGGDLCRNAGRDRCEYRVFLASNPALTDSVVAHRSLVRVVGPSQSPRARISASAVSIPEKSCWPVSRFPSRTANPRHSPAWM